jgi:hypothetical protein
MVVPEFKFPGLEDIAYRKGAEDMRRRVQVDLEALWASGECTCQGCIRELIEGIEW